jgi:hypothetical protein
VSDLEKWILGIGGAVIAAVIAAFWTHVKEDAKVRERVATLEADSGATKREVESIRKRLHDFFDGLKRGDWELIEARYEKFQVALGELKDEIRGWVEALRVEIRALVRRKRD